jgi:hypothetical protein
VSEIKADHDNLSRRNREKEVALRQYKAAEISLQEEREQLPNLK